MSMKNLTSIFLATLLLSASFSAQTLYHDSNSDGCVGLDDMLQLLSEFGSCVFNCGDAISYDGYEYSTVLIGGQCWFSENCRYLPSVNSGIESDIDPIYYVYDYEGTNVVSAKASVNYTTYGVLYNWTAVMSDSICPNGWHIPADEEWLVLANFLGGVIVAGEAMKSTSGWDNNGNGSNSSGFTGLPGGYALSGGSFFFGVNGNWWSSSPAGTTSAWYYGLNIYYSEVNRDNLDRFYGFSARCLKD